MLGGVAGRCYVRRVSAREDLATSPRPVREPGLEHPMTIATNPSRVVVAVAGRTIADSQRALTLREADYPPVHYLPLEDVDTAMLAASDHTTYCPYKGDCSYYDIPAGGERSRNGVWTYRDPHPAAEAIRGHLAFYPASVDSIEEIAAGER